MSGQTCRCVEETRNNFKLRKLSEGKYLINGRTVFVRVSFKAFFNRIFCKGMTYIDSVKFYTAFERSPCDGPNRRWLGNARRISREE